MEHTTIEECLEKNGFYVAGIVGDSMMPLLRQNKDAVKLIPAVEPLKKYDIPLYKRPTGEYVLHRIIRVKNGYYIICGDNRFLREKVPFEWIIGVTERIYRGERELLLTDKNYIKYVRRLDQTYMLRRIKRKLKKILAI